MESSNAGPVNCIRSFDKKNSPSIIAPVDTMSTLRAFRP
jgi:hypothetical protein